MGRITDFSSGHFRISSDILCHATASPSFGVVRSWIGTPLPHHLGSKAILHDPKGGVQPPVASEPWLYPPPSIFYKLWRVEGSKVVPELGKKAVGSLPSNKGGYLRSQS